MKQWFALSAIGRDRPGIVADLAELIYECDCNLEDSSMTILGSEFAVLLLLSGEGRDTADRLSIPYSLHAAGRFTSTDADAMQLAREGVATALVSIPNRYMHSPNEMVSLEDLDRAATLIAETCRVVTAETDFSAR